MEPEILFERRGEAGLITLNRPKSLNALTFSMSTAMYRALAEWERDDRITRVVVRGRGGRAFCAGGDIRQIYDLARQGLDEEVRQFWLAEYHLNAYVKRYTKPYIALIEGIVMGGGVGLSLHGSHRVASERYALAMPEVGIGFFPDVGMTHALPRLPGYAGPLSRPDRRPDRCRRCPRSGARHPSFGGGKTSTRSRMTWPKVASSDGLSTATRPPFRRLGRSRRMAVRSRPVSPPTASSKSWRDSIRTGRPSPRRPPH